MRKKENFDYVRKAEEYVIDNEAELRDRYGDDYVAVGEKEGKYSIIDHDCDLDKLFDRIDKKDDVDIAPIIGSIEEIVAEVRSVLE